MKKYYSIVLLVVGIILLTGIICITIAQSCDNEKFKKSEPTYYSNTISSPYIPDELYFAGEEVPIQVYWVYESLDRELINICYQHSRTLQIVKRSGRFFPIIEEILKEENVPDDFKYLCIAESGLENVVSPAKAAGYWQFMDATAKSYGLEIREEVDERYDLEKSTRAACKFLKSAKNRFGSWALAAAAYNMGEGGLNGNITKQGENQYWNLYLNQETARYVYRIIAYKLLFENPRFYGLNYNESQTYKPIPFNNIEVNTSIPSLYSFADSHDITYRELKELNPWLKSNKLTVNTKKYTIKIPKKSKYTFKELYQSLSNPYLLKGDTVYHSK